jgi:hypothetical protein
MEDYYSLESDSYEEEIYRESSVESFETNYRQISKNVPQRGRGFLLDAAYRAINNVQSAGSTVIRKVKSGLGFSTDFGKNLFHEINILIYNNIFIL